MRKVLYWIILAGVAVACSDSKETRLQRYLLQGNEQVALRNAEGAERYFIEALRLDSCFADALNNLGTLYFTQKKYTEAVEQYDRALACRPGYIDALLNRANANYELKEYYRALQDLDKVVKAKPDTAIVYFTRGLVYTK